MASAEESRHLAIAQAGNQDEFGELVEPYRRELQVYCYRLLGSSLDDCEFTQECVMINKGSTQVVLYYNGGSIRAEFDWPHLYSPL